MNACAYTSQSTTLEFNAVSLGKKIPERAGMINA